MAASILMLLFFLFFKKLNISAPDQKKRCFNRRKYQHENMLFFTYFFQIQFRIRIKNVYFGSASDQEDFSLKFYFAGII